MSGGGSNGAWEAGLIWGLAHYGKPQDFYWDVLTGASAGSINSAMMTPWAPSDVVKMSEWLSLQWTMLNNNELYHKWEGGFATGVLLEQGLLNDAPALKYMKSIIAQFNEIKRRFTIAAVDVSTGENIMFN